MLPAEVLRAGLSLPLESSLLAGRTHPPQPSRLANRSWACSRSIHSPRPHTLAWVRANCMEFIHGVVLRETPLLHPKHYGGHARKLLGATLLLQGRSRQSIFPATEVDTPLFVRGCGIHGGFRKRKPSDIEGDARGTTLRRLCRPQRAPWLRRVATTLRLRYDTPPHGGRPR
jgi:hypothetical protein